MIEKVEGCGLNLVGDVEMAKTSKKVVEHFKSS